MLPTGLCAQLACIWEVTARKPGNVHGHCDFENTGYVDFLLSAAAVAPVLETAPERRVGATVLQAIQATRRVVSTNTNLGIVLLLAPLASVGPTEALQSGTARVLADLNVEDARAVYQAIRLAVPGGLGRVPEQDIGGEPTQTLREVMCLAADRDLVARQYADDFREVFAEGLPALRTGLEYAGSLEQAIVYCHLHLMAAYLDSLIQRKCGLVVAEEAQARAQRVLDAGWPRAPGASTHLAQLDSWLRSAGNRRNPGTSADLVTACLFVALREGIISLPLRTTDCTGLR